MTKRPMRPAATPWLLVASVAVVCAGAAGLGATIQAPALSLSDLLFRSGVYVGDYEKNFSAVVSEEKYTQQVQGIVATGARSWNSPTHRITRSDVLLVNLGADRWMGVRDVFEVDGSPVRDHDQRLQKLVLEAPGELRSSAVQISEESARFNLGSIRRTINLPVMALEFLDLGNQARSKFRAAGTERVNDVKATLVEFGEQATPTIIGDGLGRDEPATGRFWIDADSGRVLRTELRVDDGPIHARIQVTYGPNPKIDMWVPVKMDERYELAQRAEIVTATATYSNIRKFSVNVRAIK